MAEIDWEEIREEIESAKAEIELELDFNMDSIRIEMKEAMKEIE